MDKNQQEDGEILQATIKQVIAQDNLRKELSSMLKEKHTTHYPLWGYNTNNEIVFDLSEYPEKWEGKCPAMYCSKRVDFPWLIPYSYRTDNVYVFEPIACCCPHHVINFLVESGRTNSAQLQSIFQRWMRDFTGDMNISISYMPMELIRGIHPNGYLTEEEYWKLIPTTFAMKRPHPVMFVPTFVEITDRKARIQLRNQRFQGPEIYKMDAAKNENYKKRLKEAVQKKQEQNQQVNTKIMDDLSSNTKT